MFHSSVHPEQENTMRKLSILFIMLAVLFVSTSAIAAEKVDWLDIASGAVLISATTEYNQKWAGMMLLDGSTDMGWCSKKGSPYPNTFLIELLNSVAISSFYIDNTNAQESGYPGISARRFKLYVSNKSAKEGFKLIYEGEAAKGQRKGFTIARPVPGQWLKLEVLSNWGDPQYTELMELEAYGEPAKAITAPKPIKGVYDTNYGLMWLRQIGTGIEGCYDWDNGRLTGTTDGKMPKCRQALESNTKKDAIGRSLDEVGRAIIYGIYFDFDAATIRPDSEETLNRLLEAVKARPNVKLVIEGHTDSEGSDAYNQTLSEKRAQSVVNWLVDHGIASQQLSAKGFGEFRPMADNGRPDGRALNRRVEIAIKR